MTAWTHSVPRIFQRKTKYIFCYIYRIIWGGGEAGTSPVDPLLLRFF